MMKKKKKMAENLSERKNKIYNNLDFENESRPNKWKCTFFPLFPATVSRARGNCYTSAN